MKHLAWLVVSPVAALGLATLPAGCFSSDTPPGPDSGALDDSGEDSALPTPDATMPSVDSGPGDAGKDTATAPVDAADAADARADAVVDAGPLPVTVTVLLGAAPEPGVAVVFQDATGAVLSTATTDATGTVSQLVASGSQVTAVLGTATFPNLVTIQDVVPGDTLTLVDEVPSSASNSNSVTVTLPAATWDAAAMIYTYAGRCGNTSGYPVFVSVDCASQGTFPLFAQASDSTGEIAYTYQTGNATDPDGGPLAVTVTRPWSTSAATETISASSLPSLPPDAGIFNVTPQFDYTEVAGNVPLQLLALNTPPADGGPPSEAFVIHPGYADYTQEDAHLVFGGIGGSFYSEVFAVTRTAPQTASQTTSLDLGVLPGFTSSSVDTGDAGTPTQPALSWTTTGSLSAANGIFTMVQWYASPSDGGPSRNGTWTIVAPAAATGVLAPSMPVSAAAFTPPANASYNTPRVVAVQSASLPGYAGFKSQFATIPVFSPSGQWQPSIPLLPTNGLTVYVSAIYPNEG